MTIEQKLADHAKQPGARGSTGAEIQFIEDLRKAAMCGVGYGWMQQVIEWEWQSRGPCAWGPEYFTKETRRLEKAIATFKAAFDKYAKRKHSDAHVLQPAVDALTSNNPDSKQGD